MVLHTYNTRGLCSTCYRELGATVEYRSDGAAYITKTCPEHGYEEAMVEKDYNFWETALQTDPDNKTWNEYNDVTIIEATDRCNVQCKHCYHMPDNDIPDLPAETIIARALAAPTNGVVLMGAEPTVRKDLIDIIKEIKKRPAAIPKTNVAIYTNGIKLRDPDYVQELIEAKLNSVCMSIHNPDYHQTVIWDKVSAALTNVARSKLLLGQVSFTVESKDQVRHAVDKMLWLKNHDSLPNDFCVRSPARIGIEFEQEREIFASEIFQWLAEVAQEKNLSFKKHPNYGSNPYHVGTLLDENIPIQVIHWGTVKSVDTSYMYMGPWATFIPHTYGTFLIQAILREGWKKGWWQGQRLVPETKQIYTQNISTKKIIMENLT
jgi:organic radical activating enzyme